MNTYNEQLSEAWNNYSEKVFIIIAKGISPKQWKAEIAQHPTFDLTKDTQHLDGIDYYVEPEPEFTRGGVVRELDGSLVEWRAGERIQHEPSGLPTSKTSRGYFGIDYDEMI